VLGNLINRHDAVRAYRRVRRGQLGQLAGRVRAPGPERVLAHWSAPGHAAGQVQWDDIPAVRRRWHTFGGDTTFAGHVTRRWLAGEAAHAAGVFPPGRPPAEGPGGPPPRAGTGRSGLRALSLGCGPGDREIEWARLGAFAHITGIDIAPEQAGRAARNARQAGLDDALSFHVSDARQALRDARGGYDVVLALNSLHHFTDLDGTMALIARALAPGGLLIMDEYVGPSRFQWTGAQMRAASTLLAALPQQHRIQDDGQVKRRVIRPSRLSMRLDDPSEAAESARLMPALHRHFTILEQHPYGSILHLTLHGIARNFLADDPRTAQVTQHCLAAEDHALAHLGPNFTYAICSPHATPARAQAGPAGARRAAPAASPAGL
jgi:SAM-dependent methyltransferase